MNVAAWAERNGVARVAAYRWFRAGLLRYRSEGCAARGRTAVYPLVRRFIALLSSSSVRRIVIKHRDRFCRLGSDCVEAALVVHGRELVVVDSAEVDGDLVRDMTEILASMCARLYGKRAGQNRAERALACAAEEPEAA